jgi:hypothetical protein
MRWNFLSRILHWIPKPKRQSFKPGDLVLGVSSQPRAARPFVVLPESLRSQHLGILGLSGSGKTHFIEHMIRQDIQHKVGFVVFDVHGDLAERVIGYLAERASMDPEIYERTVILEPFDPIRTFGFNPLERTGETSAFFQAQEFAHMLRKRWQEDLLSPRTEELLRNSLYTLCVNNETLARLHDLLSNRDIRTALVARLPQGEIKTYWTDRYNKLSLKMQAAFREPILTRISSFMGDPQIRDIVTQEKSTFGFGEAMRQGQWVIVNLSVGRLGENSAILGSMLFTKLELEVMARAHVPEAERTLFAVYADELQNLAGESFGRLVAEARKYRVGLVAGHQFWKQLEPYLREAMLAVGSRVLFRLHYHDAVELAGELAAGERRRYTKLLTMLDRGEAIARLGERRPVLFSVPGHRRAKPDAEELQKLKTESARRHTTLRADIQSRERKIFDAIGKRRGNETLNDAEFNEL